MSRLLNLLISASFFSMALAADDTFKIAGNAAAGTGGGVVGLIVLVLDVLVFVEVFQSTRPPGNKLLWALLVFFFPVVGVILYYLLSNRQQFRAGGEGYESIA